MAKLFNKLINNRPSIGSLSYVLYATVTSYFAFQYLAMEGFPATDVLAAICAICFVPLAFMISLIRKQERTDFDRTTQIQ